MEGCNGPEIGVPESGGQGRTSKTGMILAATSSGSGWQPGYLANSHAADRSSGTAAARAWENGASRDMAIETIPAAPVEIPSDELDLVARAKSGDSAAFSALINRYEGKIFRLAMNITQNREDAEDVLQEAFFKAFEHIDQFQGNSKFYTWIVRIAVNQALMKLRKRKSDRTVSLDEQIDTGEDMVVREVAAWDPDPEERFSREEMSQILSEAIDGLTPIYRTVFTLRDVDGLSTEETAEALDLSVPAVKSRLLRARLQLRDKLNRFFRRKGDDAFAYM
ncbi:MAG TPA: sigma-70 family RNA polymerase sigma factor [Bryobacteraceae bacterium]|nr:sigma-70 family RNA polymerase sigma factor [Bryobacteraceae bacterium]